jgi:hypothetical protein
MALELKGLKGKAVKAGGVFDRLNRAYDKLIETGDAHASDVEGLVPQIDAMQDDITFATTTLGNSVGEASGEAQDAAKAPAAVIQPETTATAPPPAAAHAEVHIAPSASNWVPPQ